MHLLYFHNSWLCVTDSSHYESHPWLQCSLQDGWWPRLYHYRPQGLFQHLSKVSGPDCIPEVVLKNYEPELSYILAELFNKCLKESCLPDCWKVLLVVPVFKNVGERSTFKNYCPFFWFPVWFQVFPITTDLLSVVSDRITRICYIW